MPMNAPHSTPAQDALRRAHADHSRAWERNRLVYAVASRRSGGISIGVNLNPDGGCTFHCVYCQVDRRTSRPHPELDLALLAEELDRILAAAADGALFLAPRFAGLPPERKRVADIAIAGDGEPTACPEFPRAVEIVIGARRRAASPPPGLVLITNGSELDEPAVIRAIDSLYAAGGEAWVKLDAGTQAAFLVIARTRLALDRILEGMTSLGRRHPIVIQSLFCRLRGAGPAEAEIEAYCRRLKALRAAGAAVRLVQIYTVARAPAEAFVTPLSGAEIDRIADRVAAETGLPVARYRPD